MRQPRIKKKRKPRIRLTKEEKIARLIKKRKSSKMSDGEKRIARYLRNNGIVFIREYHCPELINPQTGYNLFIDFFIPDLSIAIEYDGSYHFRAVESEAKLKSQKGRDKIKNHFCAGHNIWLLRIPWYRSIDLEQIICDYIDKVKGKRNNP